MALIDMVNAPWAMEPKSHGEMIDIYETHLKGEKIDLAALEARMGALPGPVRGYEIIDGVAIVPIDGIISKRMNMLTKVSGGTSLEMLGGDFRQALADPAAHAVILAIDSPGGSTMGLQEVGNIIASARGQKPIIAWTDGMMASAAYWLGSAADEVYISSDMTMVGSIGVIYKHVDRSGADAKAGLKVTEVYAGKYKTMASDNGPLTDEARADIQAKVDKLYSLFVDTVARNRGVDARTVLETMAEGRVFLGRDAHSAGLVDGVSTLDALIGDLKAGVKPASKRSNVSAAGAAAVHDAGVASANSSPNHEGPMDKNFIIANHPDIAEAFRVEGYTRGLAEGTAQGAAAELARIIGIESAALPGHAELVATLKADGKTSPGDAALMINAAERKKGSRQLENLNADAADANKVPASASASGQQPLATPKADDDQRPLEERCKATWDANADLRASFGNKYDAYLAVERAEAGGRVRVLGAKAA